MISPRPPSLCVETFSLGCIRYMHVGEGTACSTYHRLSTFYIHVSYLFNKSVLNR